MSSLMDPNGPLMSALRKMADIVLVNIMFCLVCCPVITIGAALTALHASMQVLAAGKDEEGDTVVRTFIRTFKEDFLASTKLWMVTLALIAFLVLYYTVVQSMAGGLARLYRITFYALVLIFLFGFQYIYPIEARFRLRTRDTLKNAWMLSIAAAPWTLLSLALTAGAVYITVFMNPQAFNMAVFIWVTAGFGVVAYLNSFFFLKAFQKAGVFYGIEDNDTGEQTEGALFMDEGHRKDDLMISESSYSDPNWNRKEDPEEEARHREWVKATTGRTKRR